MVSSDGISRIDHESENMMIEPIISKNVRIRLPQDFFVGEGSIVDDFCYCLDGLAWRTWHSFAAVVSQAGSATVLVFADHLPLVVRRRVGHFDTAVDFRMVLNHSCSFYGALFRDQCC